MDADGRRFGSVKGFRSGQSGSANDYLYCPRRAAVVGCRGLAFAGMIGYRLNV